MFISPAFAQGGSLFGGADSPLTSFMIPLIAMFAIMYFLIIRPQQKQRKDREALLAAVKKGDRVVTSSGLYGTVVGLSEHTVTLKVAEQVKMEFERSAIGRIVPAAGEKESSG